MMFLTASLTRIRTPMDSKLIAAVDYSPEHRLAITFHTGRVYHYFLVPPAVYAALQAAESPGRYFNTHIRNRYPTVEVTPEKGRKGGGGKGEKR